MPTARKPARRAWRIRTQEDWLDPVTQWPGEGRGVGAIGRQDSCVWRRRPPTRLPAGTNLQRLLRKVFLSFYFMYFKRVLLFFYFLENKLEQLRLMVANSVLRLIVTCRVLRVGGLFGWEQSPPTL